MTQSLFLILAQLWGYGLAIISYFIILFPSVVLVAPFPLLLRLRLIIHTWKWWSHVMISVACRAKLYTEDHRSPEMQKFPYKGLYICNHQSLLDIPVLLTRVSVPPVMKKEVLYIPFLGLSAWASGAITVDRSNKDSRKIVFEKCKARLLSGFAVQYYPEGTRSKNGEVKDFEMIKTPLIEFVYEQNIPLFACAIYGTSQALDKKSLIHPGTQLGIKMNREIYPKDFSNKEEFCRAAWGLVQSSHLELKEKLQTRSV